LAIKSCLGIHYTDSQITAVLVRSQADRFDAAEALEVTVETDTDDKAAKPVSVIEQAGQQLRQQYSNITHAVLSVTSRLYQSQFHHSQFEDIRQVHKTLRYDIEEDFALDAEDIAICYQQKPSSSPGINLLVHTAKSNQLSPLFDQFDRAGLDVLVAEPDVSSWLHYLHSQTELPDSQGCVVLARSHEAVYMLVLDKQHQPVLTRSFIAPSDQDAYEIIQCELTRSLVWLPDEQKPTYLLFHNHRLPAKQISKLAKEANLKCQVLDTPEITAVFAAGVAIGYLNKNITADFRTGSLEPRTLALGRHKALYCLSAVVSIFLLIWIFVMHTQTNKYKENHSLADEDLKKAWVSVKGELAEGEKLPRNIIKQLDSVKRSMQKTYRGQAARTIPDSASNTFTLLLNTINLLDEDVDLRIDSFSVKPNSVPTFSGSVPNLPMFYKLIETVERPGSYLKMDKFKVESRKTIGADKTNRRSFTMPLKVIRK